MTLFSYIYKVKNHEKNDKDDYNSNPKNKVLNKRSTALHIEDLQRVESKFEEVLDHETVIDRIETQMSQYSWYKFSLKQL